MSKAAMYRRDAADAAALEYADLGQEAAESFTADLVEVGVRRAEATRLAGYVADRMDALAKSYANIATDLRELSSTLSDMERAKREALEAMAGAGPAKFIIN